MTIAHSSTVRYTAFQFDRLLATSDIVSLHVPLTPETRHLIGQAELARMKRSAYLINTSRGSVIDEVALAWALAQPTDRGRCARCLRARTRGSTGICFTLENVVLAPHLGSATTETRTAMADLSASNVIAVLDGEPPLTPIS